MPRPLRPPPFPYTTLFRSELFGYGKALPGPTGESNMLKLRGRGVFVAISPWNFPLAIFTGQITAALMAGNTVVAKPADRKSTRLNSSHLGISYAVFCLKKK